MLSKQKWKIRFRKSKRLVKAGVRYLRKRGPVETIVRTASVLGLGDRISYNQWESAPLYTEEQLDTQRMESFDKDIKFSVITPLYNTDETFLREMIESMQAQTYSNWELCMADGSDIEHSYVQSVCLEYAKKDERIKYKKLENNLGIVGNSNACIDMAKGEYISILDHDDVLHPAALHDVMEVICEHDADFVYTDEAIFYSLDLSDVKVILFKPDYAPDNLLANNYICHFTSIKRSLLDKCGCFREGFDGAQDHELFLRLTDAAERVIHIPRVLYYWRLYAGSTADTEDKKSYAADAGVRAVKSFLKERGASASVDNAREGLTIYRVSYDIPYPHPLVSIIIPNYEHLEDLRGCIESIKEKTTYDNYEIIVVENNSKKSSIFEYYKEIDNEKNIKVITWPGEGFNWAALNNYAVRECSEGEYILFLNNDMTVISPDWIQEMMMYSQRPDVGATGAMLYYPDDKIQHAGVISGVDGLVTHAFVNQKRGAIGYMRRLLYAQDISAVTGACMLMRRTVFEEMGGIDETFPVNYNDVDLCFRIRDAGYLIVWTPYAELYHYESKSRGYGESAKGRAYLDAEKQHLYSKWSQLLDKGDPYYNPNLSKKGRLFELNREEYERRVRMNKEGKVR